MSFESDLQQPVVNNFLSLYILDLSTAGLIGKFHFYPGTDEYGESTTYQGNTYTPMPIIASGFNQSISGPLPRPELVVANVNGYISSILPAYNDMVGAQVTRLRTLRKYLDDGTSPDPNAFAQDVFFINTKKSESRESVTFELVSAMDLQGKVLPGRTMIANTCTWQYKGAECGWPGTNAAKWFDRNGTSVVVQAWDSCGKRVSDCKKRFGDSAELPYGGFPALGRT